MPSYSPEQINAAAAVITAGATVLIPIVLAGIAAWTKKRDDDRAEASEMREFSDQWQQFNLLVASNRDAAAAARDKVFCIPDRDGPGMVAMTQPEKQRLHLIFFKLTALYQAFYAVQRGAVRRHWPEQIIAHLAPTVFEEEDLLAIALTDRGYPVDFVNYIQSVRGSGCRLPIPNTRPNLRKMQVSLWLAIGLLAAGDVGFTGYGVISALKSVPPPPDSAVCGDIEQDMLRQTPVRPNGPALFQALGCHSKQKLAPKSSHPRRSAASVIALVTQPIISEHDQQVTSSVNAGGD